MNCYNYIVEHKCIYEIVLEISHEIFSHMFLSTPSLFSRTLEKF